MASPNRKALNFERLPERVLELCDEAGAQYARLSRNYRAAKSDAPRMAIENALLPIFTGPMWLAFYQARNGAKGGSTKSEAKTAAARANARKGGWPKGRPRKPE